MKKAKRSRAQRETEVCTPEPGIVPATDAQAQVDHVFGDLLSTIREDRAFHQLPSEFDLFVNLRNHPWTTKRGIEALRLSLRISGAHPSEDDRRSLYEALRTLYEYGEHDTSISWVNRPDRTEIEIRNIWGLPTQDPRHWPREG